MRVALTVLLSCAIAWGGPPSHTQKRVRQIKKKMVQGLLDPEKEDMFSLFVAGTDITYCYYHESERILGRTFGMCVLQVPPPPHTHTRAHRRSAAASAAVSFSGV